MLCVRQKYGGDNAAGAGGGGGHDTVHTGVAFTHTQGGGFLMSEAYTYVSVKAEVELDMFFVNLDFFNRILSDDETTVEGDLSAVSTIKYRGILGY